MVKVTHFKVNALRFKIGLGVRVPHWAQRLMMTVISPEWFETFGFDIGVPRTGVTQD